MIAIKSGGRSSVGQVYAIRSTIGVRPFLQARFAADAIRQLAALLRQAVAAPGRHRVTIIASSEVATRFRITSTASPEYEQAAPTLYLRGENLVVQGVERKSVNLDLSQDGAAMLADRLERAADGATHVHVRVPSRRRNLVELTPGDDDDNNADDLGALAAAGASLVGRTMPAAEFADWPGAVAAGES